MKNTVKTLAKFIVITTLIFAACKKEETKTTEPTPATPSAPAVVPLTATISGTNFATDIWYGSTYRVLTNKIGGNYYFSGLFSVKGNGINLKIPYGTGTYTLSASNSTTTANYSGFYSSAHDTITTFNAINGTLNITSFDTTGAGSNYIKKLKGTFSFSTAISKGISHNVTNGVIDYTY